MIKLNHFSKSVIGLVRKANEDSIGSLTNKQTNGYGDIFVVCDGMGGHVGGATASQTAVKCILQYFENEANSNPIIALEKAISFANQQIFGLAQQDSSLKGMGTTCTVLLCKEDKIYIAHVGDSRIYINTDNKLYRITKDHSFVQKLVDAGQLEDSEMETHPRKNELTKALGIGANVEVEVAENPILPKSGDKFLMCSDGLCGLVNDLTISNTINNTVGLDSVNELIQLAENAGGNDNISVDIIEIIQSPHSKTIFKDQGNKSFTATQVLEISSMKGDQKWITIFKRYHVAILCALLVLCSGLFYFTYKVIKGDIILNQFDVPVEKPITPLENLNQEQRPEIKEENNKNTSSQTETSIDSPDDNAELEWNNANNITESDIINGEGSGQFSTTEKEFKEEKRKIDHYKRLQQENNKILKSGTEKLRNLEEKMKAVNKKYSQIRPFILFKKEFEELNSIINKGEVSFIEKKIEKVDMLWDKLNKHIQYDLLLSNTKSEAEIRLENLKTNPEIQRQLETEIIDLRKALKMNNRLQIEKKLNILIRKEENIKMELRKQQKSSVTDSSNNK